MHRSESLEWTRRHAEVPGRLSLLLKSPGAGVPCARLLSTIWQLRLELCHSCM